MLPFRDTRISGVLLSLFFIALIAYGYFEARAVLWGPRIEIAGRASVSHDPLIQVSGDARNIASLSMNGKQIPVDESGRFSQPYLLAEGYNRIILTAQDKYGARQEKIIEVIYQPLDIESIASTTPPRALAPGE
jgi:hypothetical protein